MIKIAKWKYNAKSPVMFMVDDLANLWIKKSKKDTLQLGEDWGHFGDTHNSMWDFLDKNLYSLYPYIKTTFFLVTDKRSSETKDTKYSYAEAIDRDGSFMNFLERLHRDNKVELAYHGTTHGEATSTGLKQEWLTYTSLEEAIAIIEHGKRLYKKVLGEYPRGGKYCGYEKGDYGDVSINKTAFSWWCRDWDGELEKDSTREDLSYDLEYFGNVIDIPTTIDGSFLSMKKPKISKKYLRTLYKFFIRRQSLEKDIYSLYQNRQIINIQEHSSPYRTDKKIQYPNIISDIKNLQYIFKLLADLDVWYATGSEIADYFHLYSNIEIKEDENSFIFLWDKSINCKEGSIVTLIIDKNIPIEIECEGKEYISYAKNSLTLIDIPIYADVKYQIL